MTEQSFVSVGVNGEALQSEFDATATVGCGEDFIDHAATEQIEIESCGFKFELSGIEAAEHENFFHHRGHTLRIANDRLHLFGTLVNLHSGREIAEQFTGRLDNA